MLHCQQVGTSAKGNEMELKVIGMLRRYHSMTASELAEELHTSRAVISLTLQNLINKLAVMESDHGFYTLRNM